MKKMLYIKKVYLNAEANWILNLHLLRNKIIWWCGRSLILFYKYPLLLNLFSCHFLVILLIRERWMKAPSAMVSCRSHHYSFSALGMERMWCGVSHNSHITSAAPDWLFSSQPQDLQRFAPRYSCCSEGDCSTPVGSRSAPAKSQSSLSIYDSFLDFFSVCTKSCNSLNVQENPPFGLIYGTFGLLCYKKKWT